MREADGRAACVLAVGMTAAGVGYFSDALGRGLAALAIGCAAVVVGSIAGFEDLWDLFSVRAEARRPGRVPAEPGVITAPGATVLDFGLGQQRSEVVTPASVAYRDAPRRTAMYVGDPKTVMTTLALALCRDVAVVGVAILFFVLR